MGQIVSERLRVPACRLYRDEFGIHTFELTYFFSGPDGYSRIGQVWTFLTESCKRFARNRHMFLLCHGLRAAMINTPGGQRLKMIVNPRVMVDGEEGYLGITDCRSKVLDRCKFAFDWFWASHGLSFIKMDFCLLTRVDLCMGIEFLEPFSIAGYLDLLKRTPHRTNYHLERLEDEADEQHNFKIANKSRGLVVYDKMYEQRRFSPRQGETDRTLMRVEYQLYSNGLRKLAREKDLINKRELLRWILRHAPELFCEGISSCLAAEPYRSQEKVKAEINRQTSWRPETKTRMLWAQQYLYHTGDYDSLVQMMREENRLAELQMIRERYHQLGISPATLRKRSGLLYLPSLPALVLSALYRHYEEGSESS